MVISDHSEQTRFVFSCNNSTKIIDPIQSRCVVLRFKPLDEADIVQYITPICQQEGLKYTEEGLQHLAFIANGDMRNAINNLQSTSLAT